MDKDNKIKIAYICHFSNAEIHDSLPLHLDVFTRLLLIKNHLPQNTNVVEFAVWNTNAINELKKYSDRIELHVIAPYHYLKPKTYLLEKDGIHYYFFRNDDDYLPYEFLRRLFHIDCLYKRNRKIIKKFVSLIQPDVVHIVGAENPTYSLGALDMPTNVPLLVQLQTLMSDPGFEKNYPLSPAVYSYRTKMEKAVIQRADYIGFAGKHYIQIIKDSIKKDAVFVKAVLALAEPVDLSYGEKKYDFVYFSSDISKAVDLTIEAFIKASQKHPGITLNIIGGYTIALKSQIEQKLSEHQLLANVTFSGRLPSHEDVIKQIRMARFALLPLKIDVVSGTIREALANGLPVVTTATIGTPKLNEKRKTVLLSEIGDNQALANNMCNLLENPNLGDMLRRNGGLYMEETDSNELRISTYVDSYFAILNNFHKGVQIPAALLS